MTKPTVDQLLSRIKADQLYPPFLKKVKEALQTCIDQDQYYYITSGGRTVEEQQKLYDIGRVEGNGIPGHHVTNAKPGFSAHNYFIGVDGCHDGDSSKPGLQPDYNDGHYKLWADAGIKAGLTAGFYWTKEKEGIHDPPHLQLDIKSKKIKWATLLGIYNTQGGLKGVWAYLDKLGFNK